ncbi:hypothetical protein N7E70_022535 [Aminobacter sp. NyZ550]|uniref:hypothetical protein n=1 Tax=Aminobacter sp. NyZ550 TaxID=2979870 RepID=UPI0021D56FDF|nr:hypothetical protein [Aminobacter sp. NyZ550]WAX94420.1 hypothetical protein N7E70_022535 [Aminobacter sp. NyZ550]
MGTKRDDKKQSAAFIKKARELEADGEESAADELMKRLAKTPPEPRRPPAPTR